MAGNFAVGVIGFAWERALDFGDYARGRLGRWFGGFGELLAQESDVSEQRGCPWGCGLTGAVRLCVGDGGAKAQRGFGSWIGLLLAVSAWGFGGHFVEGRYRSWGGSGRNLAVGVVGFVRERALDFGDYARGRLGRWLGGFGELLAQESDVSEQRGCPWGLWFGLFLAVCAWWFWGHFVEGHRCSWGGSGRNLAVGVVGFAREHALDFGDYARGRFLCNFVAPFE